MLKCQKNLVQFFKYRPHTVFLVINGVSKLWKSKKVFVLILSFFKEKKP